MKIKVDNFDEVSKIVDSIVDQNDDFFYIELIKRQKDSTNKLKHRTIHGIFSKNTAFKVHNSTELMSLKKHIIDFCNKYSVRAYISTNPFSESLLNSLSEDPIDIDTIGLFIRMCVGMKEENHIRRVIDIDTTDVNVWNETRSALKENNIPIEMDYQTSSGGRHIVVNFSKFNKDERDNLTKKLKKENVSFHSDEKIMLYANVETKGY